MVLIVSFTVAYFVSRIDMAAWKDRGVEHYTDESVVCLSAKCLARPNVICTPDQCRSAYMPRGYMFDYVERYVMEPENGRDFGQFNYTLRTESSLPMKGITSTIVAIVVIALCVLCCLWCCLF